MVIDTKLIHAKEFAPNVHNTPFPDHRGEGANMIETDEECDQEGSISLIREVDILVPLGPLNHLVSFCGCLLGESYHSKGHPFSSTQPTRQFLRISSVSHSLYSARPV